MSMALIVKTNNNEYRNYYYDNDIDLNMFTSVASGFSSYKEAKKMLKKHRGLLKEKNIVIKKIFVE